MQIQEAVIFGIAATALHEVGHVAAALALKVKVHQVGINRKGPYIRRACGTTTQNLAVTLAGPGMNLWLAFMFYRVSPNFALCNLLIGVINLLPIPASDGSRVLQLMWKLVSLSDGTVATTSTPIISSAEVK